MTKTKSFRSWPVKKLAQKKCAKGSLRIITPKGRPDVRITVCCPPGQWMEKKKKCRVGLKPHLENKSCGLKQPGKKCGRSTY